MRRINSFKIQGLKPFTKQVKIPIKPITLLFGPNSAGKSSVFQSLLLLKQSLGIAKNQWRKGFSSGELYDYNDYNELVSWSEDSIKYQFDFSTNFDIENHLALYVNRWLTPKTIGKNIQQVLEFIEHSFSTVSLIIKNKGNSWHQSVIFELVTDNELEPFLTFSDGIIWVNHKANFWKKYYESLDKNRINELIHLMKERISEDILVRDLYDSFEESPEAEERKNEINDLVGEEAFLQYFNSLQEHEKASRCYENLFHERYWNFGDNPFFPENISIFQMRDILPGLTKNWMIERNPASIITIIAKLIEEFLHEIIHIKPLRELPKSSYSLSHKRQGNNEYSANPLGFPYNLIDYTGQLNNDFLSRINSELNHLGTNYEIEVDILDSKSGKQSEIFKVLLRNKSNNILTALNHVGFGFTQLLPVLSECFAHKITGRTLLIEQPELHLHPQMQSRLGDMFIRAAKSNNIISESIPLNRFIIETHSEHLILRLLRRIRETTAGILPENIPVFTSEDISVLYLKPTIDGTEIFEIPVSEDGDFREEWPDGFFEERDEDLFL